MNQPYRASDYAAAFRQLLPRGRVWPTEPDTQQAAVLSALSQLPARIDAAAVSLLIDAFPTTAGDLLPEWESTLGLPDPCLGPSPTLAQRKAQVKARVTASGSPTPAAIIAFAASLGFAITITSFAPFRAGRSRVGEPVRDAAWAHAWLLTVTSSAGSLDAAAFRAGQGVAGQALNVASEALAMLACELRRIMPSHTILMITY